MHRGNLNHHLKVVSLKTWFNSGGKPFRHVVVVVVVGGVVVVVVVGGFNTLIKHGVVGGVKKCEKMKK